jgi:hypothetical protein
MDREITDRVNELRRIYSREMESSSRAYRRGDVAGSRKHYAAARVARSEMNAFGFDLFGGAL